MLRTALISAAVIVLFGVLVPLRKGLDFLDPLILCGCLMLSLVMVGPAAASAFSGTPPVQGRAALRRLAIVAVYAWAIGVAVLVAGLITVNLRSPYRKAFIPETWFLITAMLFSAAATVLIGVLSALVARRYTASTARNALRLAFLGLVLFVFAIARFGGPDWPRTLHAWCTPAHLRRFFAIAAAVLAVADAALTAVLARGVGSRAVTE